MIPNSLFKFKEYVIDLDQVIFTKILNKNIKSRKPIELIVYLRGGLFVSIDSPEDIERFNNAWYSRKKNESVTIEDPIADKKLKVEKPFPKIMQSTDNPKLLVLFSEPKKGIVTHSDDRTNPLGYPLGYYSECWDMYYFEDFDGPFIVENK